MTFRRTSPLRLIGAIAVALALVAVRGLGGCTSTNPSADAGADSSFVVEDGAVPLEGGGPCTSAGGAEACGNCGTRVCTSSLEWGPCTGEGNCSPDDIKNCEVGAQTCTSSCSWGPCSCPPKPLCKKGETQACGNCGTQPCNSCGGWAACTGEGACAAGDIQNCTEGARTCTSDCAWGPCSCPKTPLCKTGDTKPCGNCGVQTCNSCGGWGACEGKGPCARGDSQSCNTYGSQSCNSSCRWNACSCSGAPVCKPGDTRACGNCGKDTCDACGHWSTKCSGQGVCTPGEVGPDGCYMGQDATCNASCQWVCP